MSSHKAIIRAVGAPGSLRRCRIEQGLSQEALARLADCSTSLVRQFEAGYQPRSSGAAERIAAALDRELHDLFPGTGSKQ